MKADGCALTTATPRNWPDSLTSLRAKNIVHAPVTMLISGLPMKKDGFAGSLSAIK